MTATKVVNTQGLVGEIIGEQRYDLRELLGGGSMGYVYRAFDRRLETDVVVKIPRRHKLENPDSMRRFKQESKFLVNLTHPHIVSILDVGEHDGAPFFVMPFVSGGCLRSRQKNELGVQKPLSPSSLCGWLLEIAKALDFVHTQDCVHRDVKPDNILFDNHGHAFLSDFGLSKIVRTAESDDDSSQTAAGAIVGTPLFTAPELVLGKPFDGRADQYSLALTVYDTLAGTNPFAGANSSATMVNQTSLVPPPLMEWNRSVSQGVWQAVLKGLSKQPKQRYESCVAFAEAVLSAVRANGSSSSSVTDTGAQSSGRRSSISNATTDTSISSRKDDAVVRRSAAQTRTTASPTSPPSGVVKGQYVVTARTPIIKAKSSCPHCSKSLVLQPAFAGKKASCQSCGTRLLISSDFSEIRKLELVVQRDGVAPSMSNNNSMVSNIATASPTGEFDLVLGQEVFGWKLNRRWALGLVGLLLLFLILMTMFFTNRANRQALEQLRQQYRPRSMEGR